jgi:hypothetical protein
MKIPSYSHVFRHALFICTLLGTAFSALLFSHTSLADNGQKTNNFALGAGVGTTGLSLNGTFQLSDNFNIRGIYANYDFTDNDTESGIAYQFDIELDTFSLLLDWHPSADNGFRISIGGVNNGTNFSAKTTQTSGNISVGNSSFAASDIGTINAKVDYDTFAPYIGIGWGNAVRQDQSLSFALDIGVIGMSNPNINLTSSGTNTTIQTALDAQLEVEKRELESSLDGFNLYPVINLSLAYRF